MNKRSLANGNDHQDADAACLAHPIKLALVKWLSKQPRSLQDIAAVFGLAPMIIFTHLAELKRAGLIERTGEKRNLLRSSAHALAHLPRTPFYFRQHAHIEAPTVRHVQRGMSLGGLSPDDV